MEATMLTADPIADTRPKPSGAPTFAGWYDPDSIVFQGSDDERAPRLLAGETGRSLLDEGGDSLLVIGGRAGDSL